MFKATLINSSGCELDHIDEKTNEGGAKAIAAWLETAQAGDVIKIKSVVEDDPMDDFNYVGSRHHY